MAPPHLVSKGKFMKYSPPCGYLPVGENFDEESIVLLLVVSKNAHKSQRSERMKNLSSLKIIE